ncbi:MAG TPA: Stp1/IreP family PP2C-type Ser/Thr phosphatase [Methylophilus sp.]|nr:Stp1/IreP family PP2C-type Ser/Thr phosphatase [Methylophilus sp.]HQQ34030.1 Stp1/IreP family PP2C-type Ser/Thr phosphatase [Methylophilus sp.]
MSVGEAIEIATLTDVGRYRTHNEDALACDMSIGLLVLADGMGGYKAGEIASEIAVLTIMAEMSEAMHEDSVPTKFHIDIAEECLSKAVLRANHTIYHISENQPQCAGMGTTLVLAFFYDNQLIAGHIGDSRLYRLRGHVLEQLTVDHSLLQEQINLGLISKEQARVSEHKNLVTRALGVDPSVELDLSKHEVEAGDLYLLCSDGLTDMLDDNVIYEALVQDGNDIEKIAADLVYLANGAGGTDNISVILAKVNRDFAIKNSWTQRLFGKAKVKNKTSA